MFICPNGHRTNMGNANSGQQRFVTAAYRYMQVNGSVTTHELIDYLKTYHGSARSNLNVRRGSSIMAQHPMFVNIGQDSVHGTNSKYAVALFDIVPEDMVVEGLVSKMTAGTSLLYGFQKYPAFIRKKVNKIMAENMMAAAELHSPNIPHEILPID